MTDEMREKAAALGIDQTRALQPVTHSAETIRQVNATNEAAYGACANHRCGSKKEELVHTLACRAVLQAPRNSAPTSWAVWRTWAALRPPSLRPWQLSQTPKTGNVRRIEPVSTTVLFSFWGSFVFFGFFVFFCFMARGLTHTKRLTRRNTIRAPARHDHAGCHSSRGARFGDVVQQRAGHDSRGVHGAIVAAVP
jgi:hypothetical protein